MNKYVSTLTGLNLLKICSNFLTPTSHVCLDSRYIMIQEVLRTASNAADTSKPQLCYYCVIILQLGFCWHCAPQYPKETKHLTAHQILIYFLNLTDSQVQKNLPNFTIVQIWNRGSKLKQAFYFEVPMLVATALCINDVHVLGYTRNSH